MTMRTPRLGYMRDLLLIPCSMATLNRAPAPSSACHRPQRQRFSLPANVFYTLSESTSVSYAIPSPLERIARQTGIIT
jgi:hypothetical protein